MSAFLKTLFARRTIYELKNTLPEGVSIEDVQSIVQDIVKNIPTAFNSQTIRAVIITGETHKAAWDACVKVIPPESYGYQRAVKCRDEAYGSVLFFDDSTAIKKLQEQFAAYASEFPTFAAASNGAAQIAAWAALEEIGLGANLQHYNPLVRQSLGDKVPEDWNLVAQLVFGTPNGAPPEKTFIENPVKILN